MSMMRGIIRLNESTVSFKLTHVPQPLILPRPRLVICLYSNVACVSMDATSRSSNFPSFHPSYIIIQSRTMPHTDLRYSKSCTISLNSVSTGFDNCSNTTKPFVITPCRRSNTSSSSSTNVIYANALSQASRVQAGCTCSGANLSNLPLYSRASLSSSTIDACNSLLNTSFTSRNSDSI